MSPRSVVRSSVVDRLYLQNARAFVSSASPRLRREGARNLRDLDLSRVPPAAASRTHYAHWCVWLARRPSKAVTPRVFTTRASYNRAKTESKMKRCLSIPLSRSPPASTFPSPLLLSFSRRVILCACSPRCNVRTIVPGRVACECIM